MFPKISDLKFLYENLFCDEQIQIVLRCSNLAMIWQYYTNITTYHAFIFIWSVNSLPNKLNPKKMVKLVAALLVGIECTYLVFESLPCIMC